MEVIDPRVLKGFRDYLPEEMMSRQFMIGKIVSVFECFGFAPLQTPSLEYSDILLGKYGDEADKLLYRFRDNGGRDVCLRYDLTVPLARVAAQYPNLPKPFKRYQIAPVWRAEKPGLGRFREFSQCDADVVGSDSLLYDAECIALDYAMMRSLGVEDFKIKISTRKVLSALGQALDIKHDEILNSIFRIIDKLPSHGLDQVKEMLSKDGECTERQIDLITRFVLIGGHNEGRLEEASRILGAVADQSVSELSTVVAYARSLGVDQSSLVIDFSIARGLDYYTGTVYETFLSDLPEVGSIMSGGRYDDLISRFLGKTVPAVGISVGVDRLFSALMELGLLQRKTTSVGAMVAAYDVDCVPRSLELLRRLRAAGIRSETAYDSKEELSLKRQLKTADRKGASFVLIVGPDEVKENAVTLRDMRKGEQLSLPVDSAVETLRFELAETLRGL